ncbi:MAG: hypothetical protein J7L88_05065 [Thermoplasmata archaeon]|nr:hypothetical protein [Thermoplasmata archaeon]
MARRSPGNTLRVHRCHTSPRASGGPSKTSRWVKEINDAVLSGLFLPFAVVLILFTWNITALLFMCIASLFLAVKTSRKGGGGGLLLYFIPLPIMVFVFGLLLYPSTSEPIITFQVGDYMTVRIGPDSIHYSLSNMFKLLAITLLIWGITFNPNGDVLFFVLKRVSRRLPIMLLSSLYLLPRVSSDAENIIEAQKVRGVLREGSFIHTVKSRGWLIMPLLRDSFLRSEALADSITARGLFDLNPPPLPLSRSPIGLLLGAVAGFLMVLIIPVILGVMLYAPTFILGAVKGVLFLLYQYALTGGGR